MSEQVHQDRADAGDELDALRRELQRLRAEQATLRRALEPVARAHLASRAAAGRGAEPAPEAAAEQLIRRFDHIRERLGGAEPTPAPQPQPASSPAAAEASAPADPLARMRQALRELLLRHDCLRSGGWDRLWAELDTTASAPEPFLQHLVGLYLPACRMHEWHATTGLAPPKGLALPPERAAALYADVDLWLAAWLGADTRLIRPATHSALDESEHWSEVVLMQGRGPSWVVHALLRAGVRRRDKVLCKARVAAVRGT
jgi:hypothetical protein